MKIIMFKSKHKQIAQLRVKHVEPHGAVCMKLVLLKTMV